MNMKELDLLKRLEEEYGFLWTNIKLELYKMIHKVIFDCEVDFDHKYIRGFSMDHAWLWF
jgi:hypothetical protein